MNYNPFLDSWFSDRWISMGVPLLMGVMLFIYMLKSAETKSKNLRKYIFVIGCIIILMLFSTAMQLNAVFLGYGSPAGILEVKCINSKLYVTDYLLSTSGGGGKFSYSSVDRHNRIHVMDLENGSKEQRFVIGKEAKFVGANGDKVAVSYFTDLLYYSGTNGKLIETYTVKTLPVLFPELSPGVSNFSWNNNGKEISIYGLDGRPWNLNTETNDLKFVDTDSEVKKNRPVYKSTNQYFIDHNKIRLDNDKYGSDHLKLKGKTGNEGRLHLYDKKRSLLLEDLAFLDGRLEMVSNKDSCFLILHYETTEHEKFIISCISMDGHKKLWELKQSSLNPDFVFGFGYKVHIAYDEQNTKLFFNIHDEIFCVDVKEGNVLWKQKL